MLKLGVLRHAATASAVADSISREYAPHALLFVRISPDMTLEEIEDVANVIMETGTDGMIVTNTTNARSS